MSEQQNFGFGKFVPGFDFLQNLNKGASQAQAAMPSLSSWVAPTLSVEEVDKRISELKAVHFWLDQNSRALSATIQALELQKMTLATLKGMNFNMTDVANSLKLDPSTGAAKPAAPAPGSVAGAATEAIAKARASKKNGKAQAPSGVVDPMQWWGALTQQFQEIAAGALKEAAKAPVAAAGDAGAARPARKPAAAAKKALAKTAGKSVAKSARNR